MKKTGTVSLSHEIWTILRSRCLFNRIPFRARGPSPNLSLEFQLHCMELFSQFLLSFVNSCNMWVITAIHCVLARWKIVVGFGLEWWWCAKRIMCAEFSFEFRNSLDSWNDPYCITGTSIIDFLQIIMLYIKYVIWVWGKCNPDCISNQQNHFLIFFENTCLELQFESVCQAELFRVLYQSLAFVFL